MEKKIVAVIMGQDCKNFLPMCLKSVEKADDIVYCDGGSSDNSQEIARKYGAEIIYNKYDQEDPQMNGKQRNFYLKYLQENYQDHWALCLDADEVVEDFAKIKQLISQIQNGVYSVKMRHLIGDLSHEDATTNEHYVLNRLFQVRYAKEYPLVEHPVLQPRDKSPVGAINCTTIWHLAYCPNMWDIKKRYESHLKKSNMHTPEFLKMWYEDHLFGTYPKKRFNPVELPKIILDEFGIDKDELYFKDRNLEIKHFIDAIHWKEFFKCKKAVEWGCGKGPRVYALNSVGVDTIGFDISEYAVNNYVGKWGKNLEFSHLEYANVVEGSLHFSEEEDQVDLSIAYDLLEHINYNNIKKAINNIINSSNKNILISVPVLGDPNLENDPTHIIKESKDWWIKQFTDEGLKLIETPNHFLFKDQILIFEKQNI